MVAAILGFVLSIATTVALFYWLRSTLHRGDAAFRKLCDKSLLQGVLSTIPTVLLSGALALALHFSGLRNANPLLYQALYKGIALALTEETVKFLTFRQVIQKNGYPYSWLDFAALMAIVGLGFGASENLEWLQLESAGTDAYVKPGVLRPGVVLTNATGAYGKAVAEHGFALTLMLQKKLYLKQFLNY